ncbi:hypothetical protein BJ170DRAFT_592907 [Xylariales sp. AK1849]|nr:hypothetical protein BJ170DRAFT_592907 [Xylariales sp. AK1849]
MASSCILGEDERRVLISALEDPTTAEFTLEEILDMRPGLERIQVPEKWKLEIDNKVIRATLFLFEQGPRARHARLDVFRRAVKRVAELEKIRDELESGLGLEGTVVWRDAQTKINNLEKELQSTQDELYARNGEVRDLEAEVEKLDTMDKKNYRKWIAKLDHKILLLEQTNDMLEERLEGLGSPGSLDDSPSRGKETYGRQRIAVAHWRLFSKMSEFDKCQVTINESGKSTENLQDLCEAIADAKNLVTEPLNIALANKTRSNAKRLQEFVDHYDLCLHRLKLGMIGMGIATPGTDARDSRLQELASTPFGSDTGSNENRTEPSEQGTSSTSNVGSGSNAGDAADTRAESNAGHAAGTRDDRQTLDEIQAHIRLIADGVNGDNPILKLLGYNGFLGVCCLLVLVVLLVFACGVIAEVVVYCKWLTVNQVTRGLYVNDGYLGFWDVFSR